jgi:hypothetical protein
VLLPEGALANSAVLLTVAGIWKPISFHFYVARVILPPRVQRETLLGPAVLDFTWLFAAAAAVQARQRARPLENKWTDWRERAAARRV